MDLTKNLLTNDSVFDSLCEGLLVPRLHEFKHLDRALDEAFKDDVVLGILGHHLTTQSLHSGLSLLL